MATYNVTAQTRRVQFTGNGTAGPFAFSFQVNATSEIKVYVDSTVKTESSHYTVSLNSGTGAGTVSFTSGNHPSSSETITILGSIPLSRTSVYTSGGQLTASSLEDDFDTNMFVHQQTNEEIDRSLRLAEHDVISGADMTLPVKDTRKGTVLGFNATTGNPEAGPNITSVQSLANVTTAINLLGTSAVVEDLGILATSAIVEDMALLATSSNVSAMALLGVSSVITDMGILGTADIVEDMGFLGTSANVTAMGHLGTSANVTAMGKLGNDATVADMAILGTDAVVANMATLATSDIISDLNTLATSDIVTDMNLLATSANVTAMGILGTSANVTAMGLLGTSTVVEDLGLLATSAVIEDMGLLATSAVIEDMGILGTSSNVTAMSNVSGSIANVNTVASNLSGVNSFAERYRIASSAPTSSLDVGDLYFDTGTNTLKVYKSSGWADAGSSVNGTSARFHYDISGTPTTVTGSDANSNTLAYDAGFIDVYVNGVRMSPADITTTSGSSVVFASALADGDEVDIVAFGTFSVSNIVSTGALNSGSITSGFGNIDTGSSTITTTGAITGGSLTGTLQTASQPNITSVGTLTSFRSTGIDDNADATAITITSAELVGISETSPLGKLHIKSGDSGASSVNGNANELVVENSDYTGLTILGENEASIMFGDNEDPDVGRIVYFHGSNTMSFMTNTNNAMHIDSTGAITKPLQPAFLATPSSSQDNFAVGSDVTVLFGTEIFDQNGDFASNTFTAPVTGKYQLQTSLRVENLDASANFYFILIKTSNRNYINIVDPDYGQDNGYFTFTLSALADMDANDTAYVIIYASGTGSVQADINNESSFSGYLVA